MSEHRRPFIRARRDPGAALVEHLEAARDRRATYWTGLVNNSLSTVFAYTVMPARNEREQVGQFTVCQTNTALRVLQMQIVVQLPQLLCVRLFVRGAVCGEASLCFSQGMHSRECF